MNWTIDICVKRRWELNEIVHDFSAPSHRSGTSYLGKHIRAMTTASITSSVATATANTSALSIVRVLEKSLPAAGCIPYNHNDQWSITLTIVSSSANNALYIIIIILQRRSRCCCCCCFYCCYCLVLLTHVLKCIHNFAHLHVARRERESIVWPMYLYIYICMYIASAGNTRAKACLF